MTAACCKEIKAGGVKWLKSAGATWVFTFFFLSIPERISRERKRELCGQSASARYLFHLWQHPWGDWAIVNLEWNISKGCWSRARAGLLGWVQAVRWNAPGSQSFLWLDEGLSPRYHGHSQINLLFIELLTDSNRYYSSRKFCLWQSHQRQIFVFCAKGCILCIQRSAKFLSKSLHTIWSCCVLILQHKNLNLPLFLFLFHAFLLWKQVSLIVILRWEKSICRTG